MIHTFDARRSGFRLAPRLGVGLAAVAALTLGYQFTVGGGFGPSLSQGDPAAINKLQHQAFAETEAQPGLNPAQSVKVKVLPGETFEGAVRRIGIAPEEATIAVSMLAQAFDIGRIRAGMELTAAVAKPRDQRGPVRLIGLSMKPEAAKLVTLSRTFDGALRLREMEEEVRDETRADCSRITSSLGDAANAIGASWPQISQMSQLFSHKVDFQRDIQPGDEFCVVFDRKVTESGVQIDSGALRYAELRAEKLGSKPLRFYRYTPSGAEKAQYLDEDGKNVRGLLLRTPLDVVRVTSNFGSRRHPILGYTRMHTGIDFGAGSGTPVYAAGDGVVVQAGRNGGYGNWVQIRHSNGWETGYAHLSRFAKGLKRGQTVSQGQLIAYVGSTGRSTGPHLHYEVIKGGKKINPRGVTIPAGTVLAGADLAAFKSEKTRMDTLVTEVAQSAQLALRPTSEPIVKTALR